MDLSRLASDHEITLTAVLEVLPGGMVIAKGVDRHGDQVIVSMTLQLSESVPSDIDRNGIVDEIGVRLISELIES